MSAYAEKLAPAHPPLAQSYFASGGWNSLACFAAFTPTLSGLERICAPADLPPRQSYFASGGWNSLAYYVALERI